MSLLDSTTSIKAGAQARPAHAVGPSAAAARLNVRVWSRVESVSAFGAVIVFAILAAAAWTLAGNVVPWDSKNHFYPMFRFLADSLARGDMPLWNPYHFGGHPSVADPQSLLFTPTMVLFALVFPKASMAMFDGAIMAHLALGGLGMIGLFRRRGWAPAAAVLAAIIFMLGGSAASRLQHTGMIISYAYFPLALLALEVALEKRSWRSGIVFGVLAALMTLGRDQVAFLCGLLLVLNLVWHVGRAKASWTYLRDRIPLLIVIGITGVALLAVPAVLTLQFLSDSNRPSIAYGVAAAGSLAPVNFMTMLAPNFFGSLDWNYQYWGPGYETIAEPDFTDRAINYLFIGTLPFVLLVWHGVAAGRLGGRGIRFFTLTIAVAALYTVGRYTPFFGLIFDHLPGISLYRRPADATFLLNIAFAFASGYLLHRYIQDGLPNFHRIMSKRMAFVAIGGTVAVVAWLVGSAFQFSGLGPHGLASLKEFGIAVAIAAFGIAVLVKLDRTRFRAVAAAVIVLVTAGEIIWRNAGASLNAEPASRYAVFDGLSESQTRGLAVLAKELNDKAIDGVLPRVEILGLGGAWQNASMALGIQNTLGYNPLRIAAYEKAVGPGENAVDLNLRHFPGTFRGYMCKLAGLLGLEYLVLDRPLTKLPRHMPRPLATPLYVGENMYIYRLRSAAPRAYLATAVKPIESDAALDDKSFPEFDRTREVLIDQAQASTLSPSLTQLTPTPVALTTPSDVRIISYSNNRVVMEVATTQAGVVVLHDLYYPGWQVKVDGVESSVLRANILFRGVEVTAGHHVVEFEFHPFALANLKAAFSSLRKHEE